MDTKLTFVVDNNVFKQERHPDHKNIVATKIQDENGTVHQVIRLLLFWRVIYEILNHYKNCSYWQSFA